MENKKVDIEEIIADARAEEEVAREMAGKAKDTFRDELREKLKEAFKPREEEKVTITLDEYVVLVNKSMDLDRVLNAIVGCLRVSSYNKDRLVLHDEHKVVDAFRVLYPEAYNEIYSKMLVDHKDKDETEGE